MYPMSGDIDPAATTPPERVEAEWEEGGDAACWLASVCPECGAFREAPGPCARCGAEPPSEVRR
ncbi:hypothetical protein ASF88_05405 [Leifsonia sp. Leaf336]|nr:hypothetical protein ASF88_05405 [Leifsonia sp. Leaf336]